MTHPVYTADEKNIRTVELEGLALLYHARSGMTHIVAPPAPQILAVLAQGPADAAGLLERLAELYQLDADEGAAAVAARLAELEAAGLVRQS